jgi:predicted O-methyltransferase YrrM
MSQELWTRIDNYFNDHLAPPDPILDAALSSAADADLPPIDVAPNQGALLHILALAQGTKIILEIGTLAGYSTICLARALPPDGQLITLEYDPKHAQVAAANIANAGLTDRVDIRVGKAIDTLPKLAQENPDPFDLIFIDADKASNPDYFNWAMKLSKIGTLIIIDNVVREGEVLNPDSEDPDIQGIRKLIKQLKAEPRITTTVIQTVGTKGHDGLALARVIK